MSYFCSYLFQPQFANGLSTILYTQQELGEYFPGKRIARVVAAKSLGSGAEKKAEAPSPPPSPFSTLKD